MKFTKQGRSDRKQHFQFSFGVPLWFTEVFDKASYRYRKWKYLANPDRCKCCNKKMYVSSYEIEHIFENGRRLLIGNHTSLVCRDCLVNQLETFAWTPRFTHMFEEKGIGKGNHQYWVKNQCDITGNKVKSFKDVEIHPFVDMTFCTNAWNYDYISENAVIECAKLGKIKTSWYGVWKKSSFEPMNHKRLFINEKGELM